ncbi:uncharacterized protein B0H18DRAFT_1032804 [Fomitopsis serialis]|uniref:uncharacterized protein n=1 Tax=Fomitopsis serialis TaxID=139415 RepID=UPI002008B1BD|nr:uncharacterized protein B0H18DRAFT_1032804 [Neoantrodia serialis]KAH9918007.1 hypothetical protein B0H18DRAFT_1032804 [Neoantrodia serialis]
MSRSENYEDIRRMFPDYLNACIVFLSMPRSNQETEGLDEFLSMCPCSCASDENTAEALEWLHAFEAARQFTLRDLTEALIRHLGGVLNDAVVSRTVGGTVATGGLTKHRKKHAGRPLWPVDPSQLLPFGLEQSMKGYATSFRLCRQDRYEETLSLINKLLAICGRTVTPHLLQFQPEWPLLITNLALRLCTERNETLGKPVELGVELNWMYALLHIVELCRNITYAANPSDIALFVRIAIRFEGSDNGTCGLLFLCDLMLNRLPLFREGTVLFPDILITELSKGFARFGAAFYLHKPTDDTRVYHQSILLQHAEMEACLEDPLQRAFECFGWASMVRHCSLPECHETFATASRTFARCAGCGVLRYCSRPCQIRAWKHATHPHKGVCTKLRVLRERTHLPRDQELDPRRDRQLFIEACEADEGLAALAEDCGKYMYGLVTARRDNSKLLVPEAFLAFWKPDTLSPVPTTATGE